MSLRPKNIDFHSTWQCLKQTIHGVVTCENVEKSVWTSKFSDVYSLCVAHPEPMAERLYAETRSFLEQHVTELLKRVEGSSDQDLTGEVFGEALLQRYYEEWKGYSQGIEYLNHLYLYLNQQHIKKQKVSEVEIIYGSAGTNPDKLEVGELGLLSWERALGKQLRIRITQALLAGVQAARENRPHQARILSTVILSFVELQAYRKKDSLALYTEMVEDPLLEAAGEHCRRLAAELLLRCDVSSYMKEVLKGLDHEMQRGRQFFHPSSISKLKNVYEKHMVADHLDILHADSKSMVIEERAEDLRNIYILLRTIPKALKPLLDITNDYIKTQGLEAISNLADEKPYNQLVEKILAIHNKYKILFTEVFETDKEFMGELDKACTAIINHQDSEGRCRSPEYLARYCDGLLKKNTRGISESEAEERLASSIVIFKYINDKDMFQKFYARFMGIRFIFQSSCSMDQEEAMINRLKQACGYEFTNKLLRMFTDVNISADLNAKFQTYLKTKNATLGISFEIHVLQSGAWPLSAGTGEKIPFPQQMEKSMQLFENFYHGVYNGRKLSWLHNQSTGELKLGYLKKTYLVTMQTPLMAVLLEFEHRDAINVDELLKISGLKLEQLIRHLTPLMDYQFITVEGEIKADSTVKLNLGFTNKRTKIRMPNINISGGSRGEQIEVEKINASVDEDRKMFLQAAIVRIMKARKALRHNDLLQEVLEQARVTFSPNVTMIKKCIEYLIEKEYIERTTGNSDEYRYLA